MRPDSRRGMLQAGVGAALALGTGLARAQTDVLFAQDQSSSSISGVSPAQLRTWLVNTPRPRVLLMRHAQTVAGTGDPPGYRLDDCSTQRNLAEEGRAQARALGSLVQAAGLQFNSVRSSRWCRCLETARLAFGHAQAWTPLNSFFDAREQGTQQLGQLRAAWQSLPAGQLTAWVTHQVVVTGLTGLWPASGEVFIIEPQPGQPVPRLIARFIAA